MTRIGMFDYGWWEPALAARRITPVCLPVAKPGSGNTYAADFPGRKTNGAAVFKTLADQPVDLLLDGGGTGLAFVADPQDEDGCELLHERLNLPLCSHFVDPMTTALQGLPWPVAWRCLQSRSWIKAVWDRAQAVELQRFGVPNVVHLPMAAPNRPYDTAPPAPSKCQPVVSFIGGQNTSYFTADVPVPPASLFPGTLAQAVQTDHPDVSFYDLYHDMYGLGEPPCAMDDLEQGAVKTSAYFNAKLFYNAALCLRQRERFVIFLKRKLGETFRLIGSNWRKTYGLDAKPPLPTTDGYFNHFRSVAVNLNLVNGNAETGLNMRHFEITAAGGFMLCYKHPELAEHFVPGKECAVFESEADLLDKIKYYLAHPDERSAIALAGQRRTLSEHLYSHRLDAILRWAKAAPTCSDRTSETASAPSTMVAPFPAPFLDKEGVGEVLSGLKNPPRPPLGKGGRKQDNLLTTAATPITTVAASPSIRETPPVEFSQSTWQEDFRAVVPDADVILDCGANVGQMADAYRRFYPKATIYSFEPVTEVFEQLQVRCQELNVHPIKKAVSDHDGRETIHLTASPEANSLLGFEPGNPCVKWTREVGRQEVAVCTLDRWCDENQIDPQRVDIIKLDVQGAELKALYGARNLLRTVRLVYLEVSFVPIYKDCPLLADIDAFMTECGFSRRAIYPSDQPQNWGDAVYVKA